MDTLEVIDRFVDRERVDADALKTALATDEGRSYLVDLLAMREMVADQTDVMPIAAPPATVRRWTPRRLIVAAAASAALAAASYQWGLHSAEIPTPRADVEAAGPARAVEAPLSAAPAPTAVIHLEPGVEWHQVVAN